jgi:hypothetical protein
MRGAGPTGSQPILGRHGEKFPWLVGCIRVRIGHTFKPRCGACGKEGEHRGYETIFTLDVALGGATATD